MKKKYFALTADGVVEYIGEFEDFDAADEAADLRCAEFGVVWLYDDAAFQRLIGSISSAQNKSGLTNR
jgi:hypothetical protein